MDEMDAGAAEPNLASTESPDLSIPGDEYGAESTSTSARETTKKVSCLSCRHSKVKCNPGEDEDQPCSRCFRLGRECLYKEHKRGRKPGRIKHVQIQRRWDTILKHLLDIQALGNTASGQDVHLVAVTEIISRIAQLPGMEPRLRALMQGDGTSEALADIDADAPHPSPDMRESFKDVGTMSRSDTSVNDGARVSFRSVKSSLEDQQHPMSIFHSPPRQAETPRLTIHPVDEPTDHESYKPVPLTVESMSNPLRLLAQATDAVRGCEEDRSSSVGEGDRSAREEALPDGAADHSRDDEGPPLQKRKRALSDGDSVPEDSAAAAANAATGAATARRRGRGVEWSSYFSRGAFHPRYDTSPAFDLIRVGVLTSDEAQQLLDHFFERGFTTFVQCLDRALCTLGYLCSHSFLLLTVLCELASENHPDLSHLHARLRSHREGLMPTILCSGFKSVEIAQALYVLASYSYMAETATADATWSLLGSAIRIATELGCNLALYSYAPVPSSLASDAAATERHQRRLRNIERTWFSLWIFEKTLSSQTGQRYSLNEDGTIAGAAIWHQQPYAQPGDEALVALIDLRRIINRATEQYQTTVAAARTDTPCHAPPLHTTENADATRRRHQQIQVDFFRASVLRDMKRWEGQWIRGPTAAAASRCGSRWRAVAMLHLHFATLITLALPLRSTSSLPSCCEVQEDEGLLYRDCYSAGIGFLSFFADHADSLQHMTNTLVVGAIYCAVFALKLAHGSLGGSTRGGSATPDGRHELPYVQVDEVEELVCQVIAALRGQKRDVPHRYAEYLASVLERSTASGRRGSSAVRQGSPLETSESRREDINPSRPPASSSIEGDGADPHAVVTPSSRPRIRGTRHSGRRPATMLDETASRRPATSQGLFFADPITSTPSFPSDQHVLRQASARDPTSSQEPGPWNAFPASTPRESGGMPSAAAPLPWELSAIGATQPGHAGHDTRRPPTPSVLRPDMRSSSSSSCARPNPSTLRSRRNGQYDSLEVRVPYQHPPPQPPPPPSPHPPWQMSYDDGMSLRSMSKTREGVETPRSAGGVGAFSVRGMNNFPASGEETAAPRWRTGGHASPHSPCFVNSVRPPRPPHAAVPPMSSPLHLAPGWPNSPMSGIVSHGGGGEGAGHLAAASMSFHLGPGADDDARNPARVALCPTDPHPHHAHAPPSFYPTPLAPPGPPGPTPTCRVGPGPPVPSTRQDAEARHEGVLGTRLGGVPPPVAAPTAEAAVTAADGTARVAGTADANAAAAVPTAASSTTDVAMSTSSTHTTTAVGAAAAAAATTTAQDEDEVWPSNAEWGGHVEEVWRMEGFEPIMEQLGLL